MNTQKTSLDRWLGNFDRNYVVAVSTVPRQLPRNVSIDKVQHGFELVCESEFDYYAVIRLCRVNRLLYRPFMGSKNSFFARFNEEGSRTWDFFFMLLKIGLGAFGGGFAFRRI